jgi:hypothetical protein
MKIIALVLLITLVAVILIYRGQTNWAEYVDAMVQGTKTTESQQVKYVNFDEVNTLPDPLKKYFRLVLKNGSPIIRRCIIFQVGGFRAKPELTEWSRMEARQYFSSHPRGFVWNSSISVAPGISIKVCDSYIDGKGEMKGNLLSTFTFIDEKNKKELNEGALQRYLAESVWFPTALLPSQGVTWEIIAKNKAKATISDSSTTVSLDFEFSDTGEIISVYTPSRYREVSGRYESTPWNGKYSNYIDFKGYLIPQKAEVEWQLKDKVYPYWKATLKEIIYD